MFASWLEESAPTEEFSAIHFPVDFFEILSTEFAACSKLPSTDTPRRASYPRTQQPDQSAG